MGVALLDIQSAGTKCVASFVKEQISNPKGWVAASHPAATRTVGSTLIQRCKMWTTPSLTLLSSRPSSCKKNPRETFLITGCFT